MASVQAVNRYEGLVLLDTDETIPMEHMLNNEGEETSNPEEVVAFIAQLPDGWWISCDISDFKPVEVH